jgi:hypothetical protein
MVGQNSRQDYDKLVEGLELALEGSIFRLLVSRGPGSSVTLSDAALAVGGDGWRALLDLTQTVARRMARAGILEFVHGDGLLGDLSMATGSAAVRLRPSRAARILGPSRLN